jgi:hypothetical protein
MHRAVGEAAMSAVTIGLLVAGYLSLLVLVLCVLTAAKRGDEARPWSAEPVDRAPVHAVERHDLGLALTDVDAVFVGRFNRSALHTAEAGGRLPPQAA